MDREPLHAAELADGPRDQDHTDPAHRDPLYASPLVERIRAELADRVRTQLIADTVTGTGTGGPLVGILGALTAPAPTPGPMPLPAPAAALLAQVTGRPVHTRDPAADARAALAHRRPQLPQDQPATSSRPLLTVGPTLAALVADQRPHELADTIRRHVLAEETAQRAAYVAQLAHELADSRPLTTEEHPTPEHPADVAHLDARDRSAVAILATDGPVTDGPVTLTGRPVHALQLADGRAFVLDGADGTNGRNAWRPLGPRPLLGTEPAPEWQCPACGAITRARMADHEPPPERTDTDASPCPRHGYPHALPCPDDQHGPSSPTERKRDPAPTPTNRRPDGLDTYERHAAWDLVRETQRTRTRLADPRPDTDHDAPHDGPQDGPQDDASTTPGPSTPDTAPTAPSGAHSGRPRPVWPTGPLQPDPAELRRANWQPEEPGAEPVAWPTDPLPPDPYGFRDQHAAPSPFPPDASELDPAGTPQDEPGWIAAAHGSRCPAHPAQVCALTCVDRPDCAERAPDVAPWCPITGRACTCSGVGPCPPIPNAPPLVGILASTPQDVAPPPHDPQDGPDVDTLADQVRDAGTWTRNTITWPVSRAFLADIGAIEPTADERATWARQAAAHAAQRRRRGPRAVRALAAARQAGRRPSRRVLAALPCSPAHHIPED